MTNFIQNYRSDDMLLKYAPISQQSVERGTLITKTLDCIWMTPLEQIVRLKQKGLINEVFHGVDKLGAWDSSSNAPVISIRDRPAEELRGYFCQKRFTE